MKPTFQFIENGRRTDSCGCEKPARRSPLTDHQFRANSYADFAGRCHGSPAPSFRRISEDYFNNEARGHFRIEAAVFGLMILTAAVPVIQGASGALHFLRVVGLL